MIDLKMLLHSVRRALRRWLGPRSAEPGDRFRFRTHLEVIALEAREVPAVFTWQAAAAGHWETTANWANPSGDPDGFPNDPNDTAQFTSTSVQDVTLNNTTTIGALRLWAGYTGSLKLGMPLTVKNGFVIEDGKIAPNSADAHLVLDGNFSGFVTAGTLGSTTHASQLQVINGATLRFVLESSVQMGMHLVIGTAGGGNGKGTVTLGDFDVGYQGRVILVKNDVNITVNKDSLLRFWGDDGDGSIDDDGVTSGHVLVKGEVRRVGVGEVEVELPFKVESGGKLIVAEGTLTIDSNGNAATQNYSLYVVSGGKVELAEVGGPPATNATLAVLQEMVIDGGKLEVFDTIATVKANLAEFKGTSEVMMTRLDDTNFTDLFFILHGENAKVKMTGGTWYFDLAAGQQGNDLVHVLDGDLEINNTGTTLDVLMLGNEVVGEEYLLFATIGDWIIGGDFATKTFRNAGFDTTYILDPLLLGGVGYLLTTK